MEKKWREHVIEDYKSLKGKRVIVRLDWNVPVVDGVITDTSRLNVTFDFIKNLSFAGAKTVLMTHFGEKGDSLVPIVSYVKQHVPFITFNSSSDFSVLEQASRQIVEGEAMLIENVRRWPGEEDCVPSLGKSFASLGDVFINNAFSVSHRSHASVVGIPKNILSYLGPLFVREIEHLTEALTPIKPALLIIGGAKISTKLPLIQRYLDLGVHVFVGGAMVHDLWKAKGMEIGKSLSDGKFSFPETLLNHPDLYMPIDVILATGETVSVQEIPADGLIVDCGPKTVNMIKKLISESKTVIINGPLGLYEKGWLKGTEAVLVNVSTGVATSYIGGGDTVAVAHSLQLLNKFHFVSLGGGAMLEFLASGTLPGIHAVTESQQTGYR